MVELSHGSIFAVTVLWLSWAKNQSLLLQYYVRTEPWINLCCYSIMVELSHRSIFAVTVIRLNLAMDQSLLLQLYG